MNQDKIPEGLLSGLRSLDTAALQRTVYDAARAFGLSEKNASRLSADPGQLKEKLSRINGPELTRMLQKLPPEKAAELLSMAKQAAEQGKDHEQ